MYVGVYVYVWEGLFGEPDLQKQLSSKPSSFPSASPPESPWWVSSI